MNKSVSKLSSCINNRMSKVFGVVRYFKILVKRNPCEGVNTLMLSTTHQASNLCTLKCWRSQFSQTFMSPTLPVRWFDGRSKHTKIDTSKVPVLCEDDLEEWYVKGSGPGGSNVNKRTNCCTLRHKPSGIILKCHLSRELNKNRKLARKMMIEKLDEFYNGEDSVTAQKQRLELKRTSSMEQKARKVLDLKKKYKDLLQTTNDECTDNR